jgi:hypothetical protein
LIFSVQPFGHQEAVMIFKTGAPVEFECGIVAVVDFEMYGVDAHFASLLFDEDYRLAAITASAVRGINVELVDEGVVAMEFEAEADGQDDIADER